MEQQHKLTNELLFVLEETIKGTEKSLNSMSTVERYSKGIIAKRYFITPAQKVIDGLKSGKLVLMSKD